MPPSVHPKGPHSSTSAMGRIFLWVSLGSVLLVTVLLAWHSLGGLDIWLHNQVGRDILSGQFPDGTNTYSYTTARPPLDQSRVAIPGAGGGHGPIS